eukprot:TRINITY_DN46072_c0_g1_i1.p1 TRINITY_DN46072_c0_g1~~TRINITY_DN46072_c0_g1_i1.p1  ORF type:complete len:306 (+),score=52.38 TRINITY_DN46072_c0_g1_i1:63-980(+)
MALTLKWMQFLGLLVGVQCSKLPQGIQDRQQPQLARLRSNRTADDRDWRPFCKYPSKSADDYLVKIYVGSGQSRKMSFGGHPVGWQSDVTCKQPATGPCSSNTRQLLLSATQACTHISCQCEQDTSSVKLEYMREMMSIVLPACQQMSEGARVIVVGLGGGALTNYILAHCPKGTRVETIESDARVSQVAHAMFGFETQAGVSELEIEDGGEALKKRVNQGVHSAYDFIIVDCMVDNDHVPDSCKNEETISAASMLLRSGGKVIQHVWKPQLAELAATFKKKFSSSLQTVPVDKTEVDFLLVGSF